MSAILTIKAKFVDEIIPTLFDDVLPLWGVPARIEAQRLIAVTDARSSHEFKVYGNRPIDEEGEVDFIISSFRPIGTASLRDTTFEAFGMFTTLRNYFKTQGNEALGGGVYMASFTTLDLMEEEAIDVDQPGTLSQVLTTLSFKAKN